MIDVTNRAVGVYLGNAAWVRTPCVREVVARIGLETLGAWTSGSGSIRKGVQGPSSCATAAAGEFFGGACVS
jgi:hypothetical protein